MNNSHLNNFYFNKYNKYKEKYLKLKNQIGGTIVDNINSIVYTSKLDLTCQLYELANSNLDISDRFLDLEYFKGLVINDKLNLPHPRMHERNFVLLPLFEIEKDWVHPIKKTNIKKLILSLSNKDIRSIKQI